MACEWQEVRIGTLCDGIFDGPHATPVRTDAGPVFLGISSLVNGRLDLSKSDHLSETDFPRWTKRVLPMKDDLVFSYETRLGEAALIPDNLRCCLGRRMALLRLNRDVVDPRFLLYAFLSPQFQDVIRSRTKQGSTVQRILLTEFGDFRIAIPELLEQKAIGATLAALDERIALLEESNKTFEALARAIFKSWFVDFDPVRAKAEGREPEGMDATAATAALFPDTLIAANNTIVARGWGREPLDQIAVFLNGLALQKFAADGDEDWLPAIKIAQLKRGSAEGADCVSRRRLPQKYLIGDGDLIFSWSGSLEVVIWCGGEGALNQHLFKVDSERFPRWFVYHWLLEHLPHFREVAASKVTTMGHIQRHHLSEAIVTVPDAPLLERLGETMTPLFEKSIHCRLQSKTLADLRDTLLPRLISGKLRVSEAEKLVEAVL
jgi:type I restriction enzyme S subunit